MTSPNSRAVEPASEPELDRAWSRASPLAEKAERGESLTMLDTERELSRLITAISTAQMDLAEFRKCRAQAYLTYRRAKLIAEESPACPRVLRGHTTVAERAAWVDAQVIEQFDLLTKWETMQEIGIEGLRSTLAQAEVVRSLNTSARASFDLAGYKR